MRMLARYGVHDDIEELFERHIVHADLPLSPEVVAAFVRDLLPVSRVAEVQVHADDPANFLSGEMGTLLGLRGWQSDGGRMRQRNPSLIRTNNTA